jgi:hypothetical protein
MNDAGSLQKLNDIVVPAPVPWWPPAPGWYVLLGIALAALALMGVLYWRRWQRNRYRRQALRDLSLIRGAASGERLRQIPELLKRAALAVWPRAEVAALNGRAWHRFLDNSAGMERFCCGAGDTLDRLAYGGDGVPLPPDHEVKQALDAAEAWLKQHARQRESG